MVIYPYLPGFRKMYIVSSIGVFYIDKNTIDTSEKGRRFLMKKHIIEINDLQDDSKWQLTQWLTLLE